MTPLNTMFNEKANATCNNTLFKNETLRVMKEMHFSMIRLYAAAAAKNVDGQSAVAKAFNFSPQRLNNWEVRGISEQGARQAQRLFGCSANWLLDESAKESDGQFPNVPVVTVVNEQLAIDLFQPRQLDRQTAELVDLFNQLDSAHKEKHLNYLKGYVAGCPPQSDGQALSMAG